MLEPWNNALVEPPPVNTFLCNEKMDTEDLTNILEDVVQALSNQSALHQEGAILSRLVYKFDKKFRNDIGYRNLKKVNTALRRYLKINLSKDVENFAALVPALDSDENYLPTRQLLEYVLVRLQSFSKVMVRICVCSKKSGVFYWDRVTRGESHWMSLMPYAVMCRIWSLTSILLKQSCKWYTRLFQYLDKLQPVGLPFLPQDYSLPVDIEQWLDIHNIDEHGAFVWSRNKSTEVISSLEDEDIEEAIDIFQYVQNVRNEMNEEKPAVDFLSSDTKLVEEIPSTEIVESPAVGVVSNVNARKRKGDFGEAISRDSFKKIIENELEVTENIVIEVPRKKRKQKRDAEAKVEEKSKTSNHIHSVDTVSNEKDVKVFIAKEDRLRNNGNKQSLSGHLSFMQWQALKMAVGGLYEAGLSDQKLVRKFKKLWKNKCVEYL